MPTGGSYIFFDYNTLSSNGPEHRAEAAAKALIEVMRRGWVCNSLWTFPATLEHLGIRATVDVELLTAIQRLTYVNVAGAPAAKGVFEWWAEKGVSMCNSWGMTELPLGACSIGQPRPETFRFNPNALLRWEDVPGYVGAQELVANPRTIFKGYYRLRDGKVLFEPVESRGFRTLDLFHQAGDSDYKFVGRLDDTIQLVNGEKVLATSVEAEIQRCNHGRLAFVAGDRAEGPSSSLVALVEMDAHDGQKRLQSAVSRANEMLMAASRLPIDHVTSIPLGSLPKTRKGVLSEARPLAASLWNSNAYERAPRDDKPCSVSILSSAGQSTKTKD